MRRGEVRLADLAPARGSEADRSRPVVIVSNDGANRAAIRLGRGVVSVVPLTTSVERVHPFQALVDSPRCGLRAPSKAQCEQVRSIDVGRLGPPLGAVSADESAAIDAALRIHLGL